MRVEATVEPSALSAEQAAKLLASRVGFRVFKDPYGRAGKDFIVAPSGTDTQRLVACPFHLSVSTPLPSVDRDVNIALYVFAQCIKSDFATDNDLVTKYAGYTKKLDVIIKAALREPNPLKFKEHVMHQAEAQLDAKFGWPLGNGAMDYYDEQTGYRSGTRAHATVEPGAGLHDRKDVAAHVAKLLRWQIGPGHGRSGFDWLVSSPDSTVILDFNTTYSHSAAQNCCFSVSLRLFNCSILTLVQHSQSLTKFMSEVSALAKKAHDVVITAARESATPADFRQVVFRDYRNIHQGAYLTGNQQDQINTDVIYHSLRSVHATVEPGMENALPVSLRNIVRQYKLNIRKYPYEYGLSDATDTVCVAYEPDEDPADARLTFFVFTKCVCHQVKLDTGLPVIRKTLSAVHELVSSCATFEEFWSALTKNVLRGGGVLKTHAARYFEHYKHTVHATVEPENEFAKELQEFKVFATHLGCHEFKIKQNTEVGPVLYASHSSQPAALKFYHSEDHVFATVQLEILGQAQLATTWDAQAQKDFLAGRVRKAVADLEEARAAARDPMELHKLVKRFAVNIKPSVVQKFLGGRA